MSETIQTAIPEFQTSVEAPNPHAAIEGLNLASDPAVRTSQLAQNTTGEGLLQAAILLHTTLAPEVVHTPSNVARTIADPVSGEVSAVLMKPEERLPFLEKAATLIKQLGESVQPGEEQAFLNRAGNITGLALVLAHTFEDGNGRTARTLAHAIRYGSEVNDHNREDFDVLSANRPTNGFKITSYLPNNEGKSLAPVELLEAAASLDIPLTNQTAYGQIAYHNFAQPYADA
ncbi:Fic family protein [Polaromonas sp.]|nr:Fic family protein [Candidatus Saccharibacteria bacterium]